jgi:hypothetical protein
MRRLILKILVKLLLTSLMSEHTLIFQKVFIKILIRKCIVLLNNIHNFLD